MRNLIGTTLHQYQIQLKIRETGTRILYKAYDTKTLQTVGVDIVKVNVKDPAFLYELLKEQASKNAELPHPNIPIAVDSGIYENLIFFVYNFSPLHSLRRLFNKTYTWQELSRELVPITKSLAVAHEHQVFHGFLNPTSIVIDTKHAPVLFDFGFEQIISNYVMSQFPGSWMNNWGFEYCSPEQLKGGKIDSRSDVYAMGMILYEWMMGETALLEESAFATLQKRNSSDMRELALGKNVSSPIQNLLKKCLATDPNDRYQTMQELSILLSRGALDLVVSEKMIRDPLLSTVPNASGKRWGITLMVVLLLVALGTGLGFWGKLSPILAINAERRNPPLSTMNSPSPSISTEIVPTATANPQGTGLINSGITDTPAALRQDPYPMLQDTPLPVQLGTLDTQVVEEIITIGLWGIGDINGLATSPDGMHIVVGSSTGIFVYDSQGLVLQKHIVTSSSVSAIVFSTNGKLLAGGDEYGLIRLWDTDSWEEMGSLSGHRLGIMDIAFSPDDTRLASVGLDNMLIKWEIGAEKDPAHVSAPVAAVTSVVFSQDGKLIGTGGNDFKINLWNATDLSLLRTITISSKVVAMTILPASNLLVAAGTDRQVTLVDVEANKLVRRVSGPQYSLSSMAASPDGTTFAGGDINGGITVWDKTGSVIWKTSNIEGVDGSDNALGYAHSLVFSSDGKTLVSGLRSGMLRVFDAYSGKEILRDQSLDVHAQKIAISYNSQYAIIQTGNGTLKVWDLHNNRYLYELHGELMDGNPVSQNNIYFAVASNPSTLKVYQLSSGKDIYTFNGHQGIKAIRFVEQGAMLAAGTEQRMHVWSMSSGQEIITKRTYNGDGCTIINSLADNPIFSITKYDHIIAITERTSLCGLQKLDWMKAFFIDESSGWVAYGGSSQLSVIGAQNAGPGPLEMTGANQKNIVSVAIYPPGNLLAAAFDDSTIHLWDITSRTELLRLFGHTKLITDLKFTPDGKLLLSTSLDGTIRLWGIPQ